AEVGGFIPVGFDPVRGAQIDGLVIDRWLQVGCKVRQRRIHGGLLLAQHMRHPRQRIVVIIWSYWDPLGLFMLGVSCLVSTVLVGIRSSVFGFGSCRCGACKI